METSKLKSFSDAELVEMVRSEGSQDAFGALYDRHFTRILNKCVIFVRNRQDAEDIAQEVFEKAFRKLHEFRGESGFGTWIFSIAVRQCMDFLRKQKKGRNEGLGENVNLPDEVEDEELLEMIAERKARLPEVMNGLQPEEKALLMMKYMEGMRLKKMQEILGIPTEAALKMKVNRAKKRLYYLFKQDLKSF